MSDETVSVDKRRYTAWLKLTAGTLLLAAVVLLLTLGNVPPGPAGDVIRNNLQKGIDATPLFYTELESATPQD